MGDNFIMDLSCHPAYVDRLCGYFLLESNNKAHLLGLDLLLLLKSFVDSFNISIPPINIKFSSQVPNYHIILIVSPIWSDLIFFKLISLIAPINFGNKSFVKFVTIHSAHVFVQALSVFIRSLSY